MANGNTTSAGSVGRTLALELVRVTERAAIAAAHLRGQGKEREADQAAVDAMRAELNTLAIDGTVVIGEGERDEAPMLYIGERLGTGAGPKVDIAVDPLEGTTLCAKDMPGAIAVMALAEAGSLLAAPDVYMQKIAIGPGYPAGLVDLDASPADNIAALARHKGVDPAQITAIILDRPRHMGLIAAVRATGAGIRLISDGDIAGIIHTTSPDETGADIYLGTGAAPEGVIAAGVLRCIGGHMQGRLILDSHEKRERAARMGISDPNRKYELHDMARGDVIVAATGVTDGALLKGVRFKPDRVETETVVYRSATGTVRRIHGERRWPRPHENGRRPDLRA
ncbi:Fructose-1,6-bisphosphatase class 2 [Methylobacterium adhaesivum]|jgi:fructose-1,6-bisphosphatase II / sedoheptulose-1,7-bisphosphatase|uniref:Fructose-1,6-bisphosphatase n=1 Tax=Methylobacterium adhaesivum TaxID=333297 RepID=A0ABT8BGE7_9HYPH|nr:class II fructose-bisphosphatase [Methylobacterium adhaesivum]MDN3590909.1 class II fructose-bisphosphatase [Methylobacterium adhaesivum]GJD29703.1 Fructose-1,6-bisphosphatase class 2 [Methylobacterium adhaesivum]